MLDDLWPDAEWIRLPGDSTRQIRVRLSFPNRLNQEFASGEFGRMVSALRQIVIQHNGWQDHYGITYPSPLNEEFWDELPQEDMLLILKALTVARGERLTRIMGAPVHTAQRCAWCQGDHTGRCERLKLVVFRPDGTVGRVEFFEREKNELEPLPTRLLAFRSAHGLTQSEAAARVGVAPNTWARWEQGRVVPSRHHRLVLADLLHQPVARPE